MSKNHLYIPPWSVEEFPDIPERTPIYITLSGNSGVGKSTLLRSISTHIYEQDNQTIAIDEKSLHHPLLQNLFDKTETYGYPLQINFMIQRVLLVKSWIDKGFNVIMERSHLEDYIFANFMYKQGYISREKHKVYLSLWNELMDIAPIPDIIVYMNFTPDFSLKNLFNDESKGIRPREFPDEKTKEQWINGWGEEYKSFIDNLPPKLTDRVVEFNQHMTVEDITNQVINSIKNKQERLCDSEPLFAR
ncbi:deoxynucleoside kinase [Vibrio mangrovi]|uniref:Deoxyadenosine/deoxycytidine kinase n=1 Tax=Vibrio mangrovi TaxID=474394 RepID=A0A1Y6IRW9_9VIBR|nr:deoxynucleoside kinase [Vibrio mangrovi]MDW6001598.1 deoxynucleoside kinase [Vibrio mangrovi]SMS00376.1 Deoxyadenosine/deoxycytidine kinase [Vibrio mangrovi]